MDGLTDGWKGRQMNRDADRKTEKMSAADIDGARRQQQGRGALFSQPAMKRRTTESDSCCHMCSYPFDGAKHEARSEDRPLNSVGEDGLPISSAWLAEQKGCSDEGGGGADIPLLLLNRAI